VNVTFHSVRPALRLHAATKARNNISKLDPTNTINELQIRSTCYHNADTLLNTDGLRVVIVVFVQILLVPRTIQFSAFSCIRHPSPSVPTGSGIKINASPMEYDPYLKQMKELKLERSIQHYTKFKQTLPWLGTDPRLNQTVLWPGANPKLFAYPIHGNMRFYIFGKMEEPRWDG